MEIFYTSKFKREYKKLPKNVKLEAEEKAALFRKNPFHPSLDTHKLHGRLREFWSFSIGFKQRIVFEFGGKNITYFHSVGDHDVYQ
ncbi:MAG: type II toxin-antitoxin system mRNA interferase toxin, RelE/StbE family [Candidatus Colwellbacteria bacterium]|nr:type II toxin-antitoxin system mRNA interferase toxin, RelE/StbE family [Candidatus Colwellbacteria bacterium]